MTSLNTCKKVKKSKFAVRVETILIRGKSGTDSLPFPSSPFARHQSLHPWPIFIFLVKARVAVFEADFLAGDPEVLNIRAQVEDVAVAGEQGRFLAGLDGTEALVETQDLRGIKRDALERLVFRHAECHGLGS